MANAKRGRGAHPGDRSPYLRMPAMPLMELPSTVFALQLARFPAVSAVEAKLHSTRELALAWESLAQEESAVRLRRWSISCVEALRKIPKIQLCCLDWLTSNWSEERSDRRANCMSGR
jgi:hypothetical protein